MSTYSIIIKLVSSAGLEPAYSLQVGDFKSPASTNFTNWTLCGVASGDRTHKTQILSLIRIPIPS